MESRPVELSVDAVAPVIVFFTVEPTPRNVSVAIVSKLVELGAKVPSAVLPNWTVIGFTGKLGRCAALNTTA